MSRVGEVRGVTRKAAGQSRGKKQVSAAPSTQSISMDSGTASNSGTSPPAEHPDGARPDACLHDAWLYDDVLAAALGTSLPGNGVV